MIEFQRRFADEETCRAYLFASRWPEGFCCPGCVPARLVVSIVVICGSAGAVAGRPR
jgi:hypothetical protein